VSINGLKYFQHIKQQITFLIIMLPLGLSLQKGVGV